MGTNNAFLKRAFGTNRAYTHCAEVVNFLVCGLLLLFASLTFEKTPILTALVILFIGSIKCMKTLQQGQWKTVDGELKRELEDDVPIFILLCIGSILCMGGLKNGNPPMVIVPTLIIFLSGVYKVFSQLKPKTKELVIQPVYLFFILMFCNSILLSL